MTKYFGKLRSITDELVVAVSLVIHKARLESSQSNASKEAKLNYADQLKQEIIKTKQETMLVEVTTFKEIGMQII